jgi:hypothetical protein
MAISLALLALAGCAALGGGAEPEPNFAPRKENVFAVTASNKLISFNAGQPQKILTSKSLTGFAAGEEVAGIDFRVAKGVLFALGKQGKNGRLYTIDTQTGKATQVGSGTFALALEGDEFGLDFNPTVDRIRLVSNTGSNARIHPDTGAIVDGNPNEAGVQADARLAYAQGDSNFGKAPAIMAAGYTYNKENEKITTNFAIDGARDALVMQGSKEGALPIVSPNTGQLTTVGSIGAGASARVSFDIYDVTNAAFGAFTRVGAKSSRWFMVDLTSGKGTFYGTIGGGEMVTGIAIEP